MAKSPDSFIPYPNPVYPISPLNKNVAQPLLYVSALLIKSFAVKGIPIFPFNS